MTTETPDIIAYNSDYLEQILELTRRAWIPVFPLMQREIPDYVYEAFYPKGWEVRQLADVEAMCRDSETDIWMTLTDNQLSGYIGLRAHDEDSMGEIYIIAVDPEYQGKGVGARLMAFGLNWMRQKVLKMAMVETGDDQGHTSSRSAYERAGFEGCCFIFPKAMRRMSTLERRGESQYQALPTHLKRWLLTILQPASVFMSSRRERPLAISISRNLSQKLTSCGLPLYPLAAI